MEHVSNSDELPWIARAGIVLGVIAVFAVVINWQSGGQFFSLVALYAAGEGDSVTNDQPRTAPQPLDEAAPTDEKIHDALGVAWDCYYDPTINDDWHDDVLCRRGFESIRPVLLPDSGFVTESEMIAAGDAYELQLNAAP